MNRKQKIIVSVVGITIVLLTLLGLTYAYFLTRIQGNTNEKSISVTTADLKLVYGDGNGLIEADSIMPGTTLTTKKFTVKNEGNAKVDNYVVYLEELVNELTRPDDMVYTLTCTSDKGDCSGKTETTFPKLAGIVVTNSIEVGEIQSYELTVTYKEMNVDQSDDMNKKISARVQIYNLQDIVDITGTVTNASEGDYVELHSDPKTSMITTNNKYLIAAVEPGTHTIYVKDKEGNVRGSKEITIKKGNTANVNGTNITVTNDSQTVNVDITAIDTTLTIDIETPKDYSPFEEGTLAYNILNNTKTNANGTTFRATPLTIPAEEIPSVECSTTITGYVTETVTTDSLCSGYAPWLVGDSEIAAAQSGSEVSSYEDAVGKYVHDQCSGWTKYLESYNSSTSSLIFKVKEEKVTCEGEMELSKTKDDYGDSYYYRGNVLDNYVNFAGMCWKIVRIEGDGSTKLILEDQDELCSETMDGNWDIPTITSSSSKTGNFGFDYSNGKATINYLNGSMENDQSIALAFKKFQTESLAKYLSYLKASDWCLDDTAYASENDNTSALTRQEMLDKQISGTLFHYDSRIRLYVKTPKEPTLKCNGTSISEFSDNTEMYVGTLTIDEIIYAGGKVYTSNPDYYLINNYQKSNSLKFWSLSPFLFDGDSDLVFFVNNDGECHYNAVVSSYSFRPAITLATGTQIASGDGTISNPYKILEN